MASNATTERKRELYVNWLNSLKESFPCEKCRLHLIKNLEEPTADGSVGPGPVEPYSKSNVSLFRHSWKLHDTVNKQLNKPKEQCLTFEEAFEVYFKTKVPVTTPVDEKPIVQKAKSSRSTSIKTRTIVSTPFRNAPKTQERFMVAAGNKMPSSMLTTPLYVEEPIEMPASLQCTSCGMPDGEVHHAAEPIIESIAEPKNDFDTFRAKSRRQFLSKN